MIVNFVSSQTSKEVLKRNVVHQLFGVDISPKLVKIAKANMLLGKDGHGGIEHANSLDSVSKLSAHFNELCGIEKPTIILTNPPFGSGHDLRIKESNVKYLDSAKASPQVKKQLDALTIYRGYILVSDSGTLGRVTYALSQHDGHVATNNLIRNVVDDVSLRGYLYEFLQSKLGQSLMLKNA